MHAVGAKVIEASDQLKMIHTMGVGYNYIDLRAAADKGIFFCNNKASNNKCVAEHTVGLMLAGLRRTVRLDQGCKKGEFQKTCLTFRLEGARELSECHVGIVGTAPSAGRSSGC
jgi:lactate dehydrogenase-like 2-hydroxyacid dehydrogenase